MLSLLHLVSKNTTISTLNLRAIFKLKGMKNPEYLEFLNRNVLQEDEVHKFYVSPFLQPNSWSRSEKVGLDPSCGYQGQQCDHLTGGYRNLAKGVRGQHCPHSCRYQESSSTWQPYLFCWTPAGMLVENKMML